MQPSNTLARRATRKFAVASAAVALMLLSGCATPQATPQAAEPEQTAAPAASGSPEAAANPTAAAENQYVEENPYGQMIVVPSDPYVKAGESVRVTGGTFPAGTTVTVYGAQPAAMPSYDAANDMYHSVGNLVLITDKLTVVTDEKGNYSVDLPLAADLGPQVVDVIVESSAPSSSGGTAALQRVYIE